MDKVLNYTYIYTVGYTSSKPPPPRPPPKKKRLMFKRAYRRIIINASVYLFQHSWKEMVFLQDFDERCAAALEITTIRSFKHEPFVFGGGGGGLLDVLYGISALIVACENCLYIFASIVFSVICVDCFLKIYLSIKFKGMTNARIHFKTSATTCHSTDND